MKTTSASALVAAGLLAQLAVAQPHLPHHGRRAVVTDINTVTVIETVTAGATVKGNWHPHQHAHSTSTSSTKKTSSKTSSKSSTKSSTKSASTSHSSTKSATASVKTSSAPAAPSKSASTAALSGYTLSSFANTYSASSKTSAASSKTSTASASTGTSTSSTGAITTGNKFMKNGIKAGLSGYVGIAKDDTAAFTKLASYIGWYSDYTATTPTSGNVTGVGMLWGNGVDCSADTDTASRLAAFEAMTTTPDIMFGFYEPDCDCPMSSNISDPVVGAKEWNQWLKPLGAKGTILGSPSMCKQKDEDWLTPFLAAGAAPWDVTSIHINKNTFQGVIDDVNYYVNKYKKPVWVSEFACVDDINGFVACTDQTAINTWLADVVPYFQAHPNVTAYGASNGEGLGTVWPLTSNGDLSATGKTYLNILAQLPTQMKTYTLPTSA